METLSQLWGKIVQIASMFNFPSDLLDIIIVACLIYGVMNIRHSRAASQIIKVAIGLLVLAYLSSALSLNTLNYIVDKTLEVGIVALVVVFQPELRRLLERIDNGSLKSMIQPKQEGNETEKTIEEVVAACRSMSRQKIGVLIVFERKSNLEEYFRTGTELDAMVSAELLKNIFFPKASLHDGAVVIRNDRVAAAGCVLPLTEDPHLSRDLGTRHRAAIGMTEHSDAVVVVVSEETGVISCMLPGVLKRFLTPDSLARLLKSELVTEKQVSRVDRFRLWLAERVESRKEDDHEEE